MLVGSVFLPALLDGKISSWSLFGNDRVVKGHKARYCGFEIS